MVAESIARFFEPQIIHFNEAILVAIIGLVVNVASMFILHDNHDHHHHVEEHSHEHHKDHNIKAAYFHV